ncbi:hypothetical protein ABZT26_25675 [Streptomyces sp. NPDC005395]|uniref:hypothetical protein n=1 Tax=Streptomyces sp. NPDC005395 TaxID=3157042 RepID=UPI0033B34F59
MSDETDARFGVLPVIEHDVDLDGEALTIRLPQPPGLQACDWVAHDQWLALFPDALPEEQRAYWHERMADPADPLTAGVLRVIAYKLAEQVYGMPWWAAHRLTVRAAASWWQFEAWCAGHGFNPHVPGTPAVRLVGACWAWLAGGLEEDKLSAFHREVFEPPKGDLGQEARLERGRAMLARFTRGQTGIM